ncbi:protein O-mannosyl-transferase family [Chryseobacterium sp. GP-SGM7]|uniref:protein O-mannosyl-transferase family n=1 Tax=Chryseobacterium sp. GP-SGM7 TaxID=3411323 RepID=UPI003B958B02
MLSFEKLSPVILFGAFLIIYILGSFSKIPFGDCIGFALLTEKGQFIDSTSTYAHFLYSNTLVLIKKIFPFIKSSEVARLVTILSAALCIPIVYKTSLLLTKNNLVSIISSIVFGFGFSFWKNTEIIEIYTFNLLFIALFFYYTLHALINDKEKLYIISSVILGISLYSHIQNILIYPAFAVLVFIKSSSKTKFISLAILGTLFLSLFIFPLKNNEPLSVVYSSGVVSEKITDTNILKSFILSLGYLFYNFWYFIIFSIPGMMILFKRAKTIFFFLIGSAAPIFIFSTVFGVSDNYVYFIPFNFIIALFISVGLNNIFSLKIKKLIALSSLMIPLFYFVTNKVLSKSEFTESFAQSKSYKGGLRYYLLPWMNDNVGILEFTIDKKKSPDPMDWMTKCAEEYIELLKDKNYTDQEIKKL